MIKESTCSKALAACVFTAALSWSAVSQATSLAFDSFATEEGGSDYNVGSIQGQNPSVGLSGFTGAWGSSSGTTAAIYVRNGGLTHSMTPGAILPGEVLPFISAGSATRRLSRAINYTPTDGTYYLSALFQKTAATSTLDILAGLSPAESATMNITAGQATQVGIYNGGISFGNNGTYTELLSDTNTLVNETYFALLEIDFSTTGTDSVTATIFDESSTQVAMQTFTGLNLDGNIGRLAFTTAQFDSTVQADEFRFGTALADVAIFAVPEPASLALWSLLGLATVGGFWLSRRRKLGSS